MTISTTTTKLVAQGNGATTVFSYSFLLPVASDAVVSITDSSGNVTTLSPSQYTLSGVGNTAGGTLTYPVSGSPLPSGSSISLQRIRPLQQLTALSGQNGYYPDVVEAALDNLQMQIQQIAAAVASALRFPGVDPSTLVSMLPAAAARANMLVAFDGSGNAVLAGPASGSATALALQYAGSNGSSFIGTLAAGTGAVSRTVQAKLRERRSVMDYGTTGDNVADDYAAIAAAIAAAAAAGGGTVYFPKPPVRYRISQRLVIPQGVILTGEGGARRWRNTVQPVRIDCYGAGAAIFQAPSGVVIDGFQMRGLHFDGTNATGGSDGLTLQGDPTPGTGGAVEGCYFEDCSFTNFPRYQAYTTGVVFDIEYQHCGFLNPDRTADDCVKIDPATSAQPGQFTFNGCWWNPYTLGKWGIRANNCTDLRIIGGTIAPYENTNGAGGGANGVLCLGGLFIYGTHIENRNNTQTANIGIMYAASNNGAFICPSQCSTFGIGLSIGDQTAFAATGWTCAGNISANNAFDLVITSGAARNGVVLGLGNTAAPQILNSRATTDSVTNEVSFLHTGQFQGFVKAPDGAAGTPSIGFINFPTSGLFTSGGDLHGTIGGNDEFALQPGVFKTKVPIFPPQDTGAYQAACGIYAGTGAPNNANGTNGCIYFRSDGGALTTVYQRRAGAWVGIV